MTTEAASPRVPGTPCWVSLMVHGMATTQDFYSALFGWEFRPGPQQLGPYVRALLAGREVAGIGVLPPERQLSLAWTPYLASDDVDAATERIRACGGTVGVGPLDAERSGRMALASDPQGAVFGVWQGHTMKGAAVFGEPGTLVWNELVTRETAAAGRFYEAVFGFEAEPVAGSHRLTLCLKGRPVASIRSAADAVLRERGPHWTTYFAVSDADAAARRVVELGGRVTDAPRDSPRGRIAVVADPEGAAFTVIQRPPR
ncbi:glyoxalase/bleomycin resistance/extradiol dioxygenase family protein [Streptomyces sp. Ru73]|uniref:VOC family protein n=1 Tax=Streptomyces sp. Ru73 TaxID=2080748 RepID=UPI000CDD3BCD|nr:VOC family protein [Streptomyces sp. Ru73]POX41077.1 glyoxalase/bleomycin resistance/extradiol dioxygenase family protein [Streptomyces sp. Ru73]